MSREQLPPLPHAIKSIRARNWNLAGAIEEFVDNSIGHGKATQINVLIDNAQGIAVRDNGIGIDDINRIFQSGNASAYGDLSQIGQYGVGATNAAIYLGDQLTVTTVTGGQFHAHKEDWSECDRSKRWAYKYTGAGRRSKINENGATILITKLARHYQLATSEKMARDFGIIFAPALRRGVKLFLYHTLANDTKQSLVVEPFTPHDLTNVTTIAGQIETKHGALRWRGRAGLSASLVQRHNGVHIAFGHRVIETTSDPFQGKSAPTLYVEVQLDETTPWKHQLSEHKDQVVRYRDELMASINASIKALLDQSSRQAQNLALNYMIAPIEDALNKALKAAGNLFIDPDEEPLEGGYIDIDTDGPNPDKKKRRHLHTVRPEGTEAKEIKRPTGISFDWCEPEKLEGRAYGWKFSEALMTILLDKTLFTPILEWPPSAKNDHLIKILVGFATHAIEIEFIDNESRLKGVLDKKLIDQFDGWMGEDNRIAPRLYRLFMNNVGRIGAK